MCFQPDLDRRQHCLQPNRTFRQAIHDPTIPPPLCHQPNNEMDHMGGYNFSSPILRRRDWRRYRGRIAMYPCATISKPLLRPLEKYHNSGCSQHTDGFCGAFTAYHQGLTLAHAVAEKAWSQRHFWNWFSVSSAFTCSRTETDRIDQEPVWPV